MAIITEWYDNVRRWLQCGFNTFNYLRQDRCYFYDLSGQANTYANNDTVNATNNLHFKYYDSNDTEISGLHTAPTFSWSTALINTANSNGVALVCGDAVTVDSDTTISYAMLFVTWSSGWAVPLAKVIVNRTITSTQTLTINATIGLALGRYSGTNITEWHDNLHRWGAYGASNIECSYCYFYNESGDLVKSTGWSGYKDVRTFVYELRMYGSNGGRLQNASSVSQKNNASGVLSPVYQNAASKMSITWIPNENMYIAYARLVAQMGLSGYDTPTIPLLEVSVNRQVNVGQSLTLTATIGI
jgi:hypothetical protein